MPDRVSADPARQEPPSDSLRRVRREGLIAYTTPAIAFAALSIQVQRGFAIRSNLGRTFSNGMRKYDLKGVVGLRYHVAPFTSILRTHRRP
jgi:hypothetical protein